jgi:GntR family transcriptional regulator
MKATKDLPGLLIDPYSQIPAYVQLKQQLRFAFTYQDIQPGDVLPSIRALATRLGVGTGEVRRAYRELCDVGFLAAEHRKHVVVTLSSTTASDAEALARECVQQCEQFIAWGRERRLSAIALGRLLLERATVIEQESPSYLFVDICRRAAEASAARVAKAWQVSVMGLSVRELTSPSRGNLRRGSTLLVNQFLYEDVLTVARAADARVFPVRMRIGDRLQRRLRRLPAKARVLLVLPDDLFAHAGGAVRRHYAHLFGRNRRFVAKPLGTAQDLFVAVKSRRFQLILLSPIVWEQVPTRLKRGSLVERMVDEPDPRSLEGARLVAGVLM